MKKCLFVSAGLILIALAAWSAVHRQATAPVVYQTIDSREFSFPDLDAPHIATVAEVEAEEATWTEPPDPYYPEGACEELPPKVRRHPWK